MAFTNDLPPEKRRWLDQNGWYVYPNPGLISDISMFWSLFCEIFETIGRGLNSNKDMAQRLAGVVSTDAFLRGQLTRLVRGGTRGFYWLGGAGVVPDPVTSTLPELLSTMRNGFSHFHWRYENLTAKEYFKSQGWQAVSDNPSFEQRATTAGHISYIVNSTARPWNGATLWSHRDLQILVTPYVDLRARLYTFINHFLCDRRLSLFGQDPTDVGADPDAS